ncbi:unnamed protein product [Rotaria sordida]|uniref:Ketoreductase domain-containing protein n=1 Tax=Rotaria sordida TaxID=392033 RepID=A0A814Z4D4_9BILA|nr:unnamed protein product [Rotaria sordida]CAF1522464.1 unnamed protein product [Rotaria sordida]
MSTFADIILPNVDIEVHKHENKYSANAHIDVVQVDVTNFEDVRDLIERFNRTPYPIRGIIHSAAVLEDHSLMKLTEENLTRVMCPKIRGAWNLHRASQLANVSLHFFVLFSSIRNHLLNFAAGSYNTGNQFLDILAYYRVKQLNLPALSISLPAVSGAGMFHRHRDSFSSVQTTIGFELVPTVGVFELIERFHANQKNNPCPVIFAVNWKKLYENYQTLVTYQLQKIVSEKHDIKDQLATSKVSSNHVGIGNLIYDCLETIIERTQITVA